MAGHIDLPGTLANVEVSAEHVADVVVAVCDVVAAVDPAHSKSAPANPPQYRNNARLLATLVQGAQIEARYEAVLARWGPRLAGVDVCSHCEVLYGFAYVDEGA